MPARYRIKFYDPRRYIRPLRERLLLDVGKQVAAHAKEVVGRPGPDPSKPGDPPHLQTGDLQAGISATIDRSSGIVSVVSTEEYGDILDAGSPTISPRPWKVRSVAEMVGKIRGLKNID